MSRIQELHASLLAKAGPSGYEAVSQKMIAELAAPLCDEVTIDVMGNVIAHKKGPGKKLMFSAHGDVIGFIVYAVDENGFLNVNPVGGHRAAFLPGTPVRFLDGLKGSLALRNRAAAMSKKGSEITVKDLYVDIGAKSREEALEHVEIGSVCVFDLPSRELCDGRIASPYMDNLICCTLLLLAMEQVKENTADLYFVFSTQEEVGLRGAQAAAYTIAPDIGIGCDICPIGDNPSVDPPAPMTGLGGGPCIILMDGSAIATPWVVNMLEKTASEIGISCQRKALASGGTDTGAIQRVRGGAAVSGVCVPTRYTHAPNEMCDEKDILDGAKLIAAIAQKDL